MGIRVKPHDIEVPKDDPFKHDTLDRRKSVEIVARLVSSVEGPAVFRLEADWGNGKTTFLRMLRQFLENKEVPVVSFNAWESDYVSDPFTAIATELTDSLSQRTQNSDDRSKDKIRAGLERAQAVMVTRAPALLRSLVGQVPVAGKALGEMVDGFADNHVQDRVSAYRDAKSSVAEFRNALEDMARTVSSDHEQPLLVVVIDELDRCRPSYAVELLEVVKHLFSVDGIVFVIAVNGAELAHSVEALYGPGFDARGYLGRFFDVDFRLPNPERSRFIELTINAVGIRSYMERTRDRDGWGEIDTLVLMLKSFLGEPVVSLRTAARAIHHLGMVYSALEDHRLVLGTITATLVILRTLDRGLYYRFIDGWVSDAEVVASMAERLGDEACARHEHSLMAFEAWITVSQKERDRGYDGMSDNRVETPLIRQYREIVAQEGVQPHQAIAQKQAHAKSVLDLLGGIYGHQRGFRGIHFKAAVERVELLSPELGEEGTEPADAR